MQKIRLMKEGLAGFFPRNYTKELQNCITGLTKEVLTSISYLVPDEMLSFSYVERENARFMKHH